MLNLRQQALEAVSRNHAPSLDFLAHDYPTLTLHDVAVLLWLHVSKLGTKRLSQLLKHFEGDMLWHLFWVPPDWAFNHYSERFSSFNSKLKNSWAEKQTVFHHALPELLLRYKNAQVGWMSQQSPLYPQALKEIHDAPCALFYRGNSHLLKQSIPFVSVVGTRDCSDYAKTHVPRLLGALAAVKPCVVSGLAQGVDALAHKAALENKLPTIAVLAGGIDKCYPAGHEPMMHDIVKAGGLVLSEMPLGVPPVARFFPRRNRIIVGLSPLLWVVEGSLRSGTMVSARIALEENRDVVVMPMDMDRPQAQGPLKLLKEGAIPVTEAEEIAQLLQVDWPKQEAAASINEAKADRVSEAVKEQPAPNQPTHTPPPVETQAAEETALSTNDNDPILHFLKSHPDQTAHVDSILSQMNQPAAELLSELTFLELDGKILRLPGNQIKLNDPC